MKEDGAFINGIKVANKIGKNGKKTLRYAILEILVEHLFNSHVMNRSEKPYLSSKELTALLASEGIVVTDKKVQIERPLEIFRKIAAKEFGASNNAIIETARWKGYRLNPAHVKLG
ncbi:hypothetical protein FACS189472_03890 [Alphaproteobacteria bacterium]|nr:hypothetical protein FACS189472_03890 [Alphaproteobacteria bacterium]